MLGVPSYVQNCPNFSKGDFTQLAFICTKSAIETPEQCVEYVQGQQKDIGTISVVAVAFEQANVGCVIGRWVL